MKVKDVIIKKKEFDKEHKRLLKTLKSKSHKDDEREYKEQMKEISKYK